METRQAGQAAVQPEGRSAQAVRAAAGQAMLSWLPEVERVFRESEGRELTQDEQTVLARFRLAELALELPMASLGTCSQDGTDFMYVDRDGEMMVCCAHGHCWKTNFRPA